MTAIIRAERLSYGIGGKALVSDMSLDVAPGRVTIVIGPNGAGKSTLVRLLSGELRPSTGSVTYLGEPLRDIRPSRLACLRAVLPQASRLAFPFTVRQVARIGLDGIGRGLDASGRDAILESSLRQADVTHLAERSYQSLSGGEQQRAQFARILAQLAAGRTVETRQALLLDEPIASLDLRHQLALLESATLLARGGVGVIAVLHDLNLAAAFGDEVVVMQGGRMAAKGPPPDVIDDAILSGVFGVDLKVGEIPGGRRPFVLPQRRDATAIR